MKIGLVLSVAFLLTVATWGRGQVGGNITFSQSAGRARAQQSERAMRMLGERDVPPSSTSMFVEASVLMNVKADEYVAVFGIMQEGETLAECGRKMEAMLKAFTDELKALDIKAGDVFADFVTQNKIYGYQLQGDVFQEKLVGFELKKNVSIHYVAPAQLEKITLAAARAQIFDLIKVDYIVKDISRVQEKLMEEAARIAKSKVARYEKLLGIKVQAPAQVYAERSAIHYPTQMYDGYTAFEAEEIRTASPALQKKYAVRSARKSSTFFFNGLDGNGFDAVVNPIVIEPVVQCTLYLKVKYELDQGKAAK